MSVTRERTVHLNRNTIHMTHPMHRMQYLLPEGYPAARGQYDKSIVDLPTSLKNVDTKGAAVHRLGTSKQPVVENWIHSIPMPPAYPLLRENEIILCEKLTIAFFWAVYAQ